MAARRWRNSAETLAGQRGRECEELLPPALLQATNHSCSVLLVRRAFQPSSCVHLQTEATAALQSIRDELGISKTRMGAANNTEAYHTFQALLTPQCGCKYDYEGTTKHGVFKKFPHGTMVAPAGALRQPQAVSRYLISAFDEFDQLNTRDRKKTHKRVPVQFAGDRRVPGDAKAVHRLAR